MNLVTLAAWFATGLLSGAAFFGSLHWLAGRLLAEGPARTGWGRLALAQVLRLALLTVLLFLAARCGAAALLACAAGVVAVRVAAVSRSRQAAPR